MVSSPGTLHEGRKSRHSHPSSYQTVGMVLKIKEHWTGSQTGIWKYWTVPSAFLRSGCLFFFPYCHTMSNSAHGRWTASQPPPGTSPWRSMAPPAQTRNGIGRQPAQQAWQAPPRISSTDGGCSQPRATHHEPNSYHDNLEGRFDLNDLEGDFDFSNLDGPFNMNDPERSDNAHYLEATSPLHSGVTPMIGNLNNEGGERPPAWAGLDHDQSCSDLDE